MENIRKPSDIFKERYGITDIEVEEVDGFMYAVMWKDNHIEWEYKLSTTKVLEHIERTSSYPENHDRNTRLGNGLFLAHFKILAMTKYTETHNFLNL